MSLTMPLLLNFDYSSFEKVSAFIAKMKEFPGWSEINAPFSGWVEHMKAQAEAKKVQE
jgi:hypothetical protein